MFHISRKLLWAMLLVASFHACKSVEKTSPSVAAAEEAKKTVTDTTVIDLADLQRDAASDTITPVWVAKKGNYNPEETRVFELINTRLDVSLDWKKQYLNGTATLTMKPYFYEQSSVLLDAKGFDIHSVDLVQPGSHKLKYEYDGYKLKVILNKTYQRNETIVLKIKYTAKPNELKEGGSTTITSDKGLYFINPLGTEPNKPQQVWTQGETQANSAWFPTFDAPNIKTTQDIYITVEKEFLTLSNGKLVSSKDNGNGTRTDYWKQEKPHAPYLFTLVVGKHKVVKDKWKDVEVNYYVEPEYEKYAKAIFGNTPEMMGHFSKLLDYPFPWDKYAQVVVRDYVSGAMENTSASTFMEALQVDNRYLLDDNWDGIIAHELFHQWFGDLVTAESWANLPLNESFANYSEYLWFEHKYGIGEADAQLREEMEQYLQESETKQEPMIRYHYTDREDMFDRHSYSKGCVILHMLRKYVGDAAFFEAMQRYLKKHQFGKTEIHQLRLVFEEVTGEDMNWFFNQWFMSAGHPVLEVTDEYENGKVTMTVKQKQDLKYTPLYTLPLYVDVWTNGKKNRHKITINQKEQTFTFESAQKPDLVFFDGETQLLGVVEHIRSTSSYVFQLKNTDKFLAKMDAIEALREEVNQDDQAKDAMFAALDDNFWQVRQSAVDAFSQYSGDDKAKVAAKVQQMALGDKKSLVRASAVNTLATLGGTYADVFLKTMQDSSYTVLANSLYAYYQMGKEDAIDRVQQYEAIDNLGVVMTIADFYSYYKQPGKLNWFISKMDKKQGQQLNFIFNYFGTYLINQPKDVQQQGITYLEDKALHSPSYQTRIAAYQAMALVGIDEVEGLKERLASIRKRETDKRAQAFYQMFGQ